MNCGVWGGPYLCKMIQTDKFFIKNFHGLNIFMLQTWNILIASLALLLSSNMYEIIQKNAGKVKICNFYLRIQRL